MGALDWLGVREGTGNATGPREVGTVVHSWLSWVSAHVRSLDVPTSPEDCNLGNPNLLTYILRVRSGLGLGPSAVPALCAGTAHAKKPSLPPLLCA